MSKRTTERAPWRAGHGGSGGTRARRRWPAMLAAAPLLLTLAACSLGRPGAPAQLFDLGPPPGAAPVADADASSLPRSAASAGLDGRAPSSGALPATERREPVAISFSAAQMLTDTGVIWRVGDSANPHSYATYRWSTGCPPRVPWCRTAWTRVRPCCR
jgi:cholesterol transport system auxiliary component